MIIMKDDLSHLMLLPSELLKSRKQKLHLVVSLPTIPWKTLNPNCNSQEQPSASYQIYFWSHCFEISGHQTGLCSPTTFHDSRKSEINSHAFIDDSFVKLPLNLSQKVSLWRYKCNIYTRFDKL